MPYGEHEIRSTQSKEPACIPAFPLPLAVRGGKLQKRALSQ
jgi:hypothetical protein